MITLNILLTPRTLLDLSGVTAARIEPNVQIEYAYIGSSYIPMHGCATTE